MREDWSLTWYPGSILPYTSLWLTVMRIVYLNRLKAWEINDLLYEDAWSAPINANQTVYINGIGSIVDTDRLAFFLGEPESAFNWSQLGRAPQWIHPLIHSHHRICIECMKVGYHSSIYSLKLLKACPIHGCDFINSCSCGEYFPDLLTQRDFKNPCQCRCGKFNILSKENSRFPAVNSDFTRPLMPIAHWLDSIKLLIRSPTNDSSMAGDRIPEWASLMPQWCGHFGIEYPDCFNHPYAPIKNYAIKASGIKARTKDPIERERRFRIAFGSSNLNTYSYTHDAAYSSYSRHIRHHIAIDSHIWIEKFRKSGNPSEISKWMTESKSAFFSFAYMLWLRETNAMMMKPSQALEDPRPHAPRVSTSKHRFEHPTKDESQPGQEIYGETQQIGWIRSHQSLAHLQNIWLVVLKRAADTVAPGEANWGYLKNSIFTPELIARRNSNGLLDLLEIQVEKNNSQIEPPRPDRKRQRIAIEQQRLARLINDFQEETLEVYLTRDEDVWREVSPMTPDWKLFRQWKLMDSGIFRHPFWLFSSGELFVARSRILPLQFCKATTASAVSELRKGSISHIGKNKIRLPDYDQKFARSNKLIQFGMSRRRLIESYQGKPDIANFWKLGDLEQFHKEQRHNR